MNTNPPPPGLRVRDLPGTIGRTITIATPSYNGSCTMDFTDSLARLQRVCSRLRIRLRWIRIDGLIVDIARERLVGQFMREPEAHGEVLVFVDADQGFYPRAIFDMVRLADQAGIIGVAVPPRGYGNVWADVQRIANAVPPEHFAETMQSLEMPWRDIRALHHVGAEDLARPVECLWVGASQLAIHRRVLDTMCARFPDLHYRHGQHHYVALFSTFMTKAGERPQEDSSFCARWRSLGGKCWAMLWHNSVHAGMRDDIRLRIALGIPFGFAPKK